MLIAMFLTQCYWNKSPHRSQAMHLPSEELIKFERLELKLNYKQIANYLALNNLFDKILYRF
jgi:hypothetical protein